MSKQASANELWEKVLHLRKLGYTWESPPVREIAIANGLTNGEALRGRIRRESDAYKAYQAPKVSTRFDAIRPPEYTYIDGVQEGVPIYDGWLRKEGDYALIGDVHLPAPNWRFMDTFLTICEHELPRPRKLVIAGDFTSNEKDSYYPHIVPPASRQTEFQMSKDVIDIYFEVFDEIDMTPGNHFHRFMKAMGGDISTDDYKALLTRNPEKLTFSIYDIVDIMSGGVGWVATHQRNYSKLKLRVADDLAQKYRKNVVTFHQHHSAIGYDKFGHQVIIDCGGMHNADGMAYVQLVPSTSNRMNNGGVILQSGRGDLIVPDKRWTDFSRWGLNYD